MRPGRLSRYKGHLLFMPPLLRCLCEVMTQTHRKGFFSCSKPADNRLRVGPAGRKRGALAALEKAGQQPGEFLLRHVHRAWGELSDEDRKGNDV